MADGEQPIERCRRIGAADGDAGDELAQVFAHPGALAQARALIPMLRALLDAAPPERAWACLEPLARTWIARAGEREYVHFHPVIKYLLDVVARVTPRDPRWSELALDAMTITKIYDETFLAVLADQPLPATRVDAMLAAGPPRPLLRALAERGDPRCRAPLEELLRASTGSGCVAAAEALRKLPSRDDALIERELVRRLADRRWDDKLDGDLADTLLAALAQAGPMQAVATYDEAWHLLSTARVAAEEPANDARLGDDLLRRLEALRPVAMADAWSRRIRVTRLQDQARLDELSEPALRRFLAITGTYEVRLGDGLLFAMLGDSHGWLFWDQDGTYREAASTAPPPTDIELPSLDGDGVAPISPDLCIVRATAVDHVVAACAGNQVEPIVATWIAVPT